MSAWTLDDTKFKRTGLSVHCIVPSARHNATAYALLRLMLERSNAAFPDMTRLSVHLAKLYAASFTGDSAVMGENRVLSFSVGGLKDRYAPKGENLSKEYARLLFGALFAPDFEDGKFKQKELEIEKEHLRDAIAAEINDKRSYCIRQAGRQFFKDSGAGVEKLGYAEDIDDITAESLTALYHEMIATARMVVIAGASLQNAKEEFLSLAPLRQEADIFTPFLPVAVERESPAHFIEEMPMVQSKACLYYTAGAPLTERERIAMRLAMTVYGAGPTSRLFVNVREKQSLCYYAAARFAAMTASARVDSGVEPKNAEKVAAAMEQERKNLAAEGPTDEEMAAARNTLRSAIAAAEDSLGAMEAWAFASFISGEHKTPAEVGQALETVTAEEVSSVLSKLSLSVVYTLAGTGAEDGQEDAEEMQP